MRLQQARGRTPRSRDPRVLGIVSLRFTPAEAEALRHLARRRRVSINALVGSLVRELLARDAYPQPETKTA